MDVTVTGSSPLEPYLKRSRRVGSCLRAAGCCFLFGALALSRMVGDPICLFVGGYLGLTSFFVEGELYVRRLYLTLQKAKPWHGIPCAIFFIVLISTVSWLQQPHLVPAVLAGTFLMVPLLLVRRAYASKLKQEWIAQGRPYAC